MEGFNTTVRVWRMYSMANDVVGGARMTGTVAYSEVPTRLEPVMPTQVLLEQGLEVPKLVSAVVRPQSLIILERDEVEVVRPSGHALYGLRLRVVGVQRDSLHPQDGRGHIELTLQRIEKQRTIQ